jgi:molybdopterin-synthase adenylyltransferase
MLTESENERYARHLLLEKLGAAGQERIRKGRVLVVGAGGLGSPAAFYLAAAGIGTLGIVDFDKIELSNLQRQILHTTGRIGRSKTGSAAETIRALNPGVIVREYPERLTVGNACAIVRDYDFVIDATDGFGSKFLINDACVREGVPFSHAGVLALAGQTMTVLPGRTACYRCVFGDLPPKGAVPSTAQVGVFGPVPGILGTIQAAEALKCIARMEGLLLDKLLVMDAGSMEFRTVGIRRDPECKACGKEKRWPMAYDA